ncbi:hypothetical protein NHX12_005655, partial [Muraenolepis orangiensis]
QYSSSPAPLLAARAFHHCQVQAVQPRLTALGVKHLNSMSVQEPVKEKRVGTTHSQRVGTTHSQRVGTTHSQRVGTTHSQRVGTTHSQRVGTTHSQRVGTTHSQRDGPWPALMAGIIAKS